MRKALLLAAVLVVATAAAVKAQAPLSPKKMNAAKEAALATVNIEAAKAHISFPHSSQSESLSHPSPKSQKSS